MNQKTLSVAMIGAGNILSSHLAALRSLPRLHLKSLCGLQPELASRASELGARPYSDYRAALAERPDVVVVSLPHDLHYPVAREALEAGSHVMLEKPMALSVVQINHLLTLAATNKRALIVSDTAYTSDLFTAGRRIVQDSGYGRFVSGHYLNHRYYFSEGRPDWFYDPQRSGGGQFLNIGVHRIAAVRNILGDELQEVRVMASSQRLGQFATIETATTAMVSYQNGAAMVYEEYGYIKPPVSPKWSLRLMFERGVVGLEPDRIWSSDADGNVTAHGAPAADVNDYRPLYEQLLRAIDCQSYFPTAMQGARDTRIALAAYASAREGVCIDLRETAWALEGAAMSMTSPNGKKSLGIPLSSAPKQRIQKAPAQ